MNKSIAIGVISVIIIGIVFVGIFATSSPVGVEEPSGNNITVELSESIGLRGP